MRTVGQRGCAGADFNESLGNRFARSHTDVLAIGDEERAYAIVWGAEQQDTFSSDGLLRKRGRRVLGGNRLSL